MDDLYDNLDNYSEESTIAELREENKELKFKLEEYAVTLDKLQKELDMLASEHKKLEANYSSLLKTARSEIERKTQIITKLNIEKDAMVLNSIQNRNTPHNRRKPKQKNNMGESTFGKQTVVGCENSWKPSPPNQVPDKRNEVNILPVVNIYTPLSNIQTRLLDIVNNAIGNPKMDNAENIEVNDNIRLKDGERPRARISERRKSMPVFSMDCAKFSTDEDELASTGSSKELMSKDPERRNLDRFTNAYNGKTSIEDKMSGHHASSRETRSRNSKQYDNDKYRGRDKYEASLRYRRNHSPDRNRKGSPDRRKGSPGRRRGSPERRRGSPERKRSSPDRSKRGTCDLSEEFNLRQDYNRRRRLVSPHVDKYHDNKHRSRDSRRSNDRNHQDGDKYTSRSQDMHTLKHKMPHDYEEPCKKMRLDSHHKHEDDRWRNERQVVPEPLDFDHLHNMSCQSPEYTHSEAQSVHLIREIKLNATTDLDDPRISSKKYSLKTHEGRAELSTVGSANIDVKVIDTSGWSKIKKMKMPDALLQKPVSTVLSGLPNPMSTDLPHASIKRTISTGKSNALVQKPKSPDMLDDFPVKSKSINKPDALIQKPKSPDMLDDFPVKSKSINKPDALVQKPKSPDRLDDFPVKSKSINKPDALVQKPKSPDMLDDFPVKSKSINKPDALVQKPKSPDMPDALPQKLLSTDKPDALVQSPKSTDGPHDLVQQPKSANMTDAFIKKLVATDMPDILTQTPVSIVTPTLDTSIKKPKSTDDLVKEIYMDIENPITNISMESGEIYDDVETRVSLDARTKEKIEETRQEVFEQQKHENGSSKLSKYKIPKKSSDDTHSAKISNDVLDKHKDNLKPNLKLTSKISAKINDSSKATTETATKYDKSPGQNKRKLPQRRSSDFQYEFQNYVTTNEMIEGDLELSDEDHTDIKIMKPTPISDDKQDVYSKEARHDSRDIKMNEAKPPDQSKVEFDETSQKLVKLNVEEKSKETTVKVKQPKTKKKLLKLKEIKVLNQDENAALSMDKPVEKKANTTKETPEHKDTLSLDQLVKIKDKIKKELLENKDTTLAVDKPVKKKEKKTSVLSKNKDTVLALDKTVKKKENKPKEITEKKDTALPLEKTVEKKGSKPKEPLENKDTAAVDKLNKKKENITKESSEHKNVLPVDKPGKKKPNKLKDSSDNTELAALTKDKQVKRKDKEYKAQETKFSELFGDSSSLVSPEDLGLVPAVVPQENYVAMFEDAQDAIDMNSIRSPVAVESTEIHQKTDTQSNFGMNFENIKTQVITDEPKIIHQKPVNEESLQAESILIQNIYQNLQPEITPKEMDTEKTIIISTGMQPQCTLEATETNPTVNDSSEGDLHVMQCVKPTVLKDMVMKALATSTPQKIWQQNTVQTELDPTMPNSKCDSNESQDASGDKTSGIDNSDNMHTSRTNGADEPDVRIFVKRRRKVLKKK